VVALREPGLQALGREGRRIGLRNPHEVEPDGLGALGESGLEGGAL
jgi:hypothetical protein